MWQTTLILSNRRMRKKRKMMEGRRKLLLPKLVKKNITSDLELERLSKIQNPPEIFPI